MKFSLLSQIFLFQDKIFTDSRHFLKLNVCLDKYFEVKIFTVWDKTVKPAKIFALEKFKLYDIVSKMKPCTYTDHSIIMQIYEVINVYHNDLELPKKILLLVPDIY